MDEGRRSGRNGLRAQADLSEGFGERLLGQLLDRAHQMPPHLIAPLVAEEISRIGGRDTSIYLQDHEQRLLVPFEGRGLTGGDPVVIDGSQPGEAFLTMRPVQEHRSDEVRMHLPLLDGTEEVGVLSLTLDTVEENDLRLLRRLAGLVADMIVTKNNYTDDFFLTRCRGEPMSVAAEIQYKLLPPLSMTTPQVSVAGLLEPTYKVAGDSLDYVLNKDVLHVAVIDAMGHGLNAAMLSTVAMGAYRHARRSDVELADLYRFMDAAMDEVFGPEDFVTGQMMRLNVTTGQLQWVNAGHPAPMVLRGHRVVQRLESPTTLPVGFGGATPTVSTVQLRRYDRVLAFTDGLVEEHKISGEQFGEQRLIDTVEYVSPLTDGVNHLVRRLSLDLKRQRGDVTSDDATLLVIEWTGGTADHLAAPDL
ncbi:PP2C family protein-serine/threonine phosphatase [Streptomyces nanshensis]|uniref:Phosphatase n=1 Tax=Streptomyces nanshensis TaxID=518642 RepID=A0A1E7L858_9ACTN|nr:PP2C family protein-serine/threonine phosphatase [Streptomyces nanshensis]OEV12412.1 phosphatase [Streptomyces nanshensis]